MAFSEPYALSLWLLGFTFLLMLTLAFLASRILPLWPRATPPALPEQASDLHPSVVEQYVRFSDNWRDSFDEFLNRRNEFWSLFGQLALSILVILFISVLLLMGVISAEAGLPILAGIGGIALGKGVQGARLVVSARKPMQPGEEELSRTR